MIWEMLGRDILLTIASLLDVLSVMRYCSTCSVCAQLRDKVMYDLLDAEYDNKILQLYQTKIGNAFGLYKLMYSMEKNLVFKHNTSGITYYLNGKVAQCRNGYHSNIVTNICLGEPVHYWEYYIVQMGKESWPGQANSSQSMWFGVCFEQKTYQSCMCMSGAYEGIGWYLFSKKVIVGTPVPNYKGTIGANGPFVAESPIVLYDVPENFVPKEKDCIGLLLDTNSQTLTFYLNKIAVIEIKNIPQRNYFPLIELHGGDFVRLFPTGKKEFPEFVVQNVFQ